MSKNARIRRQYAVRSVVMIALTVAVSLPLYYVVINAFKTPTEMSRQPFGLPSQFSLSNFIQVFQDNDIGRAFANTALVTVVSVFFQVLIGSMAAYGMILRKSVFTSAVGAVLLIAFTIPMQATLIPLYRLEADLGVVNTLTGLILIYLGSAIFCYFLIVGYMRKLPTEVLEAARMDGAGPFRIYAQVVLPLITPILTTVIVFQTLATWNDFLWPTVLLSSEDNRTIVLAVFNAVGQFSTNWPVFMAVTVIALIPVFIFFMFCQRWIVAGLASGAVKG